MEHNLERLKAHILPLSKGETFEQARKEWDLVAVEISNDFDSCPCGQEIKEHCYIENRLTHAHTYVGNVCINRFLGISTGSLFDGLRRIRDNPTANANDAVIAYADERGFLHESELKFLTSTRLTRVLSVKQIIWKQKINRRIISGVVVQKRSTR